MALWFDNLTARLDAIEYDVADSTDNEVTRSPFGEGCEL